MKSSPLLNRRTANPPETSKRPVDLSTRGSSSTRQTISEEGSSVGIMPICATALFSMWDVAIMPHIRPRQIGRVVDLSLIPACVPGETPARCEMHTKSHSRPPPPLYQSPPLPPHQTAPR